MILLRQVYYKNYSTRLAFNSGWGSYRAAKFQNWKTFIYHILVRHEGVRYQRMKVPPGKLSVHSG